MKKLIILLAFSLTGLHAQVLKTTPDGFLLVKDSISNVQIVPDTFINFKSKLMYRITNSKDWFEKNSGKYFIPKVEENLYMVLRKKGGWGVINIQGDVFIPFKETSPVYLFRNATCYGTKVKEGSGIYNRLNKNNNYLESFTIIDFEGNVIASYSGMVDEFRGSCLVYDQNSEKYGIINSVIDTVAEFKYTCTSWDDKNFGFSDRGFVAFKNPDKKCGIISYKGKTVMPFAYDYIDDLVFPTALIKKDQKWGLLNNKDLRIKVPIKYEDIQCSSNGSMGDFFTAFAKDSTGYDVYDSTFKLMGHYDFEEFGYVIRDPNLVHVKLKGNYGLYNFIQNKFAFPPVYQSIDYWCGYDCETGLYLLSTGDSVFVVNSGGKIFASFRGTELTSLSTPYSKLQLEDGKFLLLKDFKPVSSELYDKIDHVYADKYPRTRYFIVAKNNQFGVCDTFAHMIVPYQYKRIDQDFQQDYYLLLAERNNAIECFDKDLNLINSQPFEIFTEWWKPYLSDNNSIDVVSCNGKFGLFDFKTRTFTINPEYNNYQMVSVEDLMNKPDHYFYVFLMNGQVSLVNKESKLLFKVEGEAVNTTYSNEKFILTKNGKSYLVDMSGKIVSKPYDSLACIGNESQLMVIKNKNKYGIINLDEKVIYKPEYSRFCNSTDLLKDYGYSFIMAKPKEAIYLDNYGVIIRTEKDDYWFYCGTGY